MKEWKKTTCAMCGVRCGLEVKVEKNRIVKPARTRTARSAKDTSAERA